MVIVVWLKLPDVSCAQALIVCEPGESEPLLKLEEQEVADLPEQDFINLLSKYKAER